MIKVAGELLVDLDADDMTAGTAIWHNKGTLGGDFKSKGSPTKGLNGGKNAVLFNGMGDAYLGPNSVATIEGQDDRSIEVWAYNAMVDDYEETMVSWSAREPEVVKTMMSFNYGKQKTWGAATHWDADLDWGSMGNNTPNQATWHHLVYTYDGNKAIVFADGTKKNERMIDLKTKGGFSINLAVQRGSTNFFIYGSMAIAVVRVHSEALKAGEVKANYDAEKSRFQ